jgi:hypothetical protein
MADFAVLEFALPSRKRDQSRIVRVRPLNPELSERLVCRGDFVALVGHPRGGYKRGSLGRASDDQRDQGPLHYYEDMSRPGSGGSPVFGFNTHLSGDQATALHCRNGLGSTIRGAVMAAIGEQYTAQHGELNFDAESEMRLWARNSGFSFV